MKISNSTQLLAVALLCATAIVCPAQAQPAATAPVPARSIEDSLRESREITWRGSLKLRNIDVATQDVLMQVIAEQEAATEPLRAQAKRLAQAVASKEISDAQISAMLGELRADLAAEKERREAARLEWKPKVNYEANPLLEYSLAFFGLVNGQVDTLDAVPQALKRLGVKSVPEAMKKLGVEDEKDQKTILTFVAWQEKLYQPFLEWANNDQVALRFNGDDVRQTALRELREGTAEYLAISQRSLQKVDARIGYSGKPRLESQMFLMGLLGDEASVLDGFNARGTSQFKRFKSVLTGEKAEN